MSSENNKVHNLFSYKGFTKDDLEKIGNSIIYFAEKVKNLSKTKLLKLVYLLDELSVNKYGIPFFNLSYKVWQAGPVNVDIYTELSSTPILLKDYIKLQFLQKGECYITPKKKFNDAEFSDNEIGLLEIVLSSYGKLSAKKLVELCHRQTTLWYQIAKEKGVLELFEKGKLNTTDYEIQLSDNIKDDKVKLSIYDDHREFLKFSKRFKA